MDLCCSVTEINGDSGRKSQVFILLYLTPREDIFLWLFTAVGLEKLERCLSENVKKLTIISIPHNTGIKQTDGRTKLLKQVSMLCMLTHDKKTSEEHKINTSRLK